MRIAKADNEDFETTNNFLRACESLWQRRQYSLNNPEESWGEWEDDDPDKIELLRIRKSLSKEDGFDEKDVDNRLIVYEFIKQKYKECDCNWARVTLGARILIDNMCDPQKTYLDYSPYLTDIHVSPEQ